MNATPVTLQISLAPPDHRHAEHLLRHQVAVWRTQVAEILLVVDTHRSAGRFAEGWDEGTERIIRLARSIPGARVLEVDYRPEAQAAVGGEFFGGLARVPAKDFRGGPFYSYFFALHSAACDWVLHADSDLMFGGGAGSWVQEAVADQLADPRVLLSAPHPGPPHVDGKLRGQKARPAPGRTAAHDFDSMSTRLFLLSRTRFREAVGSLRPRRPGIREQLKALIEGNPAKDLPEHLFTVAMRSRELVRREFLGAAPGMWHLHPPYRNAEFYARLPEIIARCEQGTVPEEQRGDHDINDSLVDWSDARAALRTNRWWHRILRR